MAGKTVYVCAGCGYESGRWLGKCPGCGSWNTMEEVRPMTPVKGARAAAATGAAVPLAQVQGEDFPRTQTRIGELDRVLGGGLVSGSLVLIGGDPGIGKSTLLLQAAHRLALQGRRVLYVSGEESTRQVAMRAARLGVEAGELYLLSETRLEAILGELERLKPAFAVVDSIQTVSRDDGTAGSVTQVREAAAALLAYAKGTGCTVLLVGHVTKAGAIAGPRVLEHTVDTVLYFEGDGEHMYRILRAVKNRFGSTQEIGIFEMGETGMREVDNPSELFLSPGTGGGPGSAVTCAMEGTRPVAVEIQALVARSPSVARRQCSGLDPSRLMLLTAVLEKRARFELYNQDIYLNVAGGLRIQETAADLAAVMAMASSAVGMQLPERTAVFGEVGLTGEVRPVRFAQLRLAELARLGFARVILPQRSLRGLTVPAGMTAVGVERISDALGELVLCPAGDEA